MEEKGGQDSHEPSIDRGWRTDTVSLLVCAVGCSMCHSKHVEARGHLSEADAPELPLGGLAMKCRPLALVAGTFTH